MRLNFCKYHVQDRDYSRAEVVSLMNNEFNKHLVLSGSNWTYSLGSIGETASYILGPVIVVTALVGAAVMIVANPDSLKNTNPGTIHYSPAPVKFNQYKLTDVTDNVYTGREVTKFMNEFYDYSIHLNKNLYYDIVINDFLNHKYIDVEVPTLGTSGPFDVAVLDKYV